MPPTTADDVRHWAGRPSPPADAGRLSEVGGWAGVTAAPQGPLGDAWLPAQLRVWTAGCGDLLVARGLRHRVSRAPVVGTGYAWQDDEQARFVARCEGLERYASLVYALDDFLLAPAAALGDGAMSFDGMARFSATEIASALGALTPPSRHSSLRWSDGVDLHTGRPCRLPLVMTVIPSERLDGERFWLPFSTGVAVHSTVEQALVGAIGEVIERDAVALWWLQRLPLPRLDPGVLTAETTATTSWFADRGVRTLLFDATTDLGIPTVVCLQLADEAVVAQAVGSATAAEHGSAAAKALGEAAGGRFRLHSSAPAPRRYIEYTDLLEGARHMSRKARRRAFAFLLDGLEDRPVAPVSGGDAGDGLDHLLHTLAAAGLRAYASDLTTAEVRAAGLVAVRVVIPQLVPMSVLPWGRYLGTPRLYEAPRRMGHRARVESRLNSYPVPIS
jgi:ribosomal protein S12 methylthiotransferase accessory factor